MIRRLFCAFGLMAGVILLLGCGSVWAAVLPAGFVESVVASGLSAPTAMAFTPDGRIFVTEQGGQLRVIKNEAGNNFPLVVKHNGVQPGCRGRHRLKTKQQVFCFIGRRS